MCPSSFPKAEIFAETAGLFAGRRIHSVSACSSRKSYAFTTRSHTYRSSARPGATFASAPNAMLGWAPPLWVGSRHAGSGRSRERSSKLWCPRTTLWKSVASSFWIAKERLSDPNLSMRTRPKDAGGSWPRSRPSHVERKSPRHLRMSAPARCSRSDAGADSSSKGGLRQLGPPG